MRGKSAMQSRAARGAQVRRGSVDTFAEGLLCIYGFIYTHMHVLMHSMRHAQLRIQLSHQMTHVYHFVICFFWVCNVH